MRVLRFVPDRVLAGLVACMAVSVLATAAQAQSLQAKYAERLREISLITSMESSLFAASEAEKLAVMADTDEASVEFADKATAIANAIEKARQELSELVKQGKLDKEAALLADFSTCWTEFRKLDKEILDLAVKNTNIKAARLSQGKARELVAAFADCLNRVLSGPQGATPDPAARVLADKALIAVQQVQILHSPHIDESGASRMDALEAEMRSREAEARDALSRFSGLPGASGVKECGAILEEYAQVTASIVALSRQNTNLDSLRLSLSRKRSATASCSEILAALKKTAFDRGFKATR
ncbi:MCP four helix bundle domain-containing protein [Fundidesulfovibrio terrae]|uniref:MCP four helix bundle domain-containing protein n=1 Tax=Fundidesulfovibrio terrae TaxID=2922866 RepID=UPI002435648D|nr:MCP four helix bundle domain-containing protein [Fundidesulfovibrio terrae]